MESILITRKKGAYKNKVENMQRSSIKSCTKINHELKLSHAISRLLWTQQYDLYTFILFSVCNTFMERGEKKRVANNNNNCWCRLGAEQSN